MTFPDDSKPDPKKPQYRLQLEDLNWTPWTDFDVPVRVNRVLSLIVSENMTKEQYREFIKQFTTVP